MLTLSTPTSQSSEKVLVNEFNDLSIRRSENYYEKRKVSVGYNIFFYVVSVWMN